MKLLIAGLVGAATNPTLVAAPPAHGLAVPCRIVSVHDGDTATVEVTTRVQVRLDNCWAPELREGGGPESGDALRAAAVGKRGTLFCPFEGANHLGQLTTLGRVVGVLWVEGETESLNARQVRTKNASTAKGRPLGQ